MYSNNKFKELKEYNNYLNTNPRKKAQKCRYVYKVVKRKSRMMKKKLPLYIADIADKQSDKMLSLSLTEKPASGFMGMVIDETPEAQVVFFPILPANKPIYRCNETYGEHYVIFLPDVISDIMHDANKRRIPFDLEHQGEPLKGVEWVESFQIDYKRGKLFKSYPGLTDGTWCGILKINKDTPYFFNPKNMVNRAFGGDVSPLYFSGISISGIFSYHEVSLSEAIEFYNKVKI